MTWVKSYRNCAVLSCKEELRLLHGHMDELSKMKQRCRTNGEGCGQVAASPALTRSLGITAMGPSFHKVTTRRYVSARRTACVTVRCSMHIGQQKLEHDVAGIRQVFGNVKRTQEKIIEELLRISANNQARCRSYKYETVCRWNCHVFTKTDRCHIR